MTIQRSINYDYIVHRGVVKRGRFGCESGPAGSINWNTFSKTHMMGCTLQSDDNVFHSNRRQSLGMYFAFIFIALEGKINCLFISNQFIEVSLNGSFWCYNTRRAVWIQLLKFMVMTVMLIEEITERAKVRVQNKNFIAGP